MAKEFNDLADYSLARSQVEEELLELLLASDDVTYPWNIADSEVEVYFANREQGLLLEDSSDAQMDTKEQAFFNQLEEIWSTTTSMDVSETE